MNILIDETGKYSKYITMSSMEQLNQFKKYYYLYEYTDKLQPIIDNSQYPSMLNYVKTGLLTEEEMIQALLYK